MGLRDRLFELQTIEQLDTFLKRYPTCALFKAGSCHKTMQGFGYVEQALDKYDNLFMGFVRVVECRPVSNKIAELTGVIHQSPQLIILVNGKPVYDVDNWSMNVEVISRALLGAFGPPSGNGSGAPKFIDPESVAAYVAMLKQFVGGELSAAEFENKWLLTFRDDASLRPAKEFSLLNSLFGDVDAALAGEGQNPYALMSHSKEELLKQRAEKLLEKMVSSQQ